MTYRIYGCESTREGQYEHTLDTYEKTAVRSNVWQSALPPLYLAVSEAGVLFILWFGAKNVLGSGWRAWDIAAFTTFLSCFTKLTVKSSKVAKLFNSVQKAEVSWKRIQPLMKSPETLEPLAVPSAMDVTLENLSFAYGDQPIFSGLSLTAHPGTSSALPGRWPAASPPSDGCSSAKRPTAARRNSGRPSFPPSPPSNRGDRGIFGARPGAERRHHPE